jgi:dTDP-4-dehydrorhamnose 3,5-epimerase
VSVRFEPTALADVILVEPDVHRDSRGFFLETYHAAKYRDGGIPLAFVQDNHSHSSRGTLRGLHLQCRKPQGKLVRVLAGEIYDVAVDVRRGSPTFGRWVGATLSGDNFRQLYVPPGFAHGFCVTGDMADVEYKCTDLYDRDDELTIAWNDPQIGVEWPVGEPTLSARDGSALRLAELTDRLPSFRPR